MALVGLLAFWHQLAAGAAGCFTTLAGPAPQQGSPASAPRGGSGASAPQEPPTHPTVRLRLPPTAPEADTENTAPTDTPSGTPTRVLHDADPPPTGD